MRQEHARGVAARADEPDAHARRLTPYGDSFVIGGAAARLKSDVPLRLAARVVFEHDAEVGLARRARNQLVGARAVFDLEAVRRQPPDVDAPRGEEFEEGFEVAPLSPADVRERAVDEDSVVITLRFADGSNGCVAYLAEGDRALAKECVEIFGGGRSFVLEDFRRAVMYRGGREEVLKPRAQDKGQAAQARAVCAVVAGSEPSPFTLEELANTTRATFRIRESLRTGRALDV